MLFLEPGEQERIYGDHPDDREKIPEETGGERITDQRFYPFQKQPCDDPSYKKPEDPLFPGIGDLEPDAGGLDIITDRKGASGAGGLQTVHGIIDVDGTG